MKFSNLEMASRVSAEVAGKVSEYAYCYHRTIDFPRVSGISVDTMLVKRC